MPAHHTLRQHFDRIGAVEGAVAVLHWDAAAMMPRGGAEARADQLATLSVIRHEMLTDPRMADWIEAAESEGLEGWDAANVYEIRRAWQHATAVPADLVSALSKAGSDCEMTWRTARKANDWKRLQPKLEAVVELVRQKAAAKAEALGRTPYEALLDQFEPGGTTASIDAVFADLVEFLPGFIDAVLSKQAAGPKILMPDGPFDVDAQRALGLSIMNTLGFEFDHGRLDVSHHPFCGGIADDVRITTRYDEDDFVKSLMGVIHETGHALYERGLPAAWRKQPVGLARGMSMHESQSLLMEMQACRSQAFIHWAAPQIRAAFKGDGAAWTAENLYRVYTKVERSLIRVDADEVTYPAHVILRYRLEKALLSGDLQVADLPGAWRDGMLELVGIAPPDDASGCMQDIHWMDGTIGYFPTYTLGAMTAAQLFDAACKADADIMPGIGRGDFAPLLNWLRPNVHAQGSRLSTDELLTRATGRPLDAAVFKAHLTRRYLEG
jgi:carboxypeptidase Taq